MSSATTSTFSWNPHLRATPRVLSRPYLWTIANSISHCSGLRRPISATAHLPFWASSSASPGLSDPARVDARRSAKQRTASRDSDEAVPPAIIGKELDLRCRCQEQVKRAGWHARWSLRSWFLGKYLWVACRWLPREEFLYKSRGSSLWTRSVRGRSASTQWLLLPA